MNKFRGFLIKAIGSKKRKEINKDLVKKILIPGGRIGDIVCSTPFIREIHKIFPKAQMDIYLDKVTSPILEECPYINVITTEKSSRLVHKIKILRILFSYYDSFLKRGKYDLCFDFTNNMHIYNILSLRILNPRYILGAFRKEKYGIKKDELTIFTKYISNSKSSHISDICLSFAEYFNPNIENRKYEIYLGDKENKYEKYFNKEKINILFNYIGGAPQKILSLEEVRESCFKIIETNKNIVVYVMTLPNEYEKMTKEIKNWKEERIKLSVKTENILDAAALIKYSDILISVDTDVVHIASAFNIPVISIFPDNDNSIKYFSPKSDFSYVIKCEDKRYIKNFNKVEMQKIIEKFIKDNKYFAEVM